MTDALRLEVGAASMGFPVPEGGYHPLRDPTNVSRVRMLNFGTWVSSYYNHPCFSNDYSSTSISSASSGLFTITSPSSITDNANEEEQRKRIITKLQTRTPAPGTASRPCTLETIPPADLLESIDTAPASRSEQAFVELGTEILGKIRRKALSLTSSDDSDDALATERSDDDDLKSNVQDKGRVNPTPTLPDLRVYLIYGTASVWSAPWGAWQLEAEYVRLRAQGMPLRELKIVRVDGANHFVRVLKLFRLYPMMKLT